MNQGSAENSNRITILVFKDNYAAKTFQIPLKWLSQLGIFLGLLIGTTVVSLFLSLKYYHIASKSNPTHTQELEQEIFELKGSLKNPDVKPSGTLQTVAPPAPLPQLSPTPEAKGTLQNNSLKLIQFTAFSKDLILSPADPQQLPINIQSPSANWKSKNLIVRFALQYTKQDQGNQQGKIFIIARGPATLLSYPFGTFNRAGSQNLIAFEQGESFSVSRYREVIATFGPITSHRSIQDIEILIFDREGQLLIYKKLLPESQEPQTHEPTAEEP